MLTRYLPGKHLVGHVGAAGAQMQKSQCVGTGTVYITTSYDTNNVQRGGGIRVTEDAHNKRWRNYGGFWLQLPQVKHLVLLGPSARVKVCGQYLMVL